MIEAEMKARVRDPGRVQGLLRSRGAEQLTRYRDTYYDRPDRALTADGRELRLRVVDAGGRRRCLLTCKGRAVDERTGSKPETEIEVSDDRAADEILLALGFSHLVTFEQHCANYAFRASGRDVLATVVTVPELEGTFIEVETMAADDEVDQALAAVRAVLDDPIRTPGCTACSHSRSRTAGARRSGGAGRRARDRRLFIPDLIWDLDDGWQVPVRRQDNPDRWEALVAADEAVITQLDDGAAYHGPDPERRASWLTSSSSAPWLMNRMLDALELEPGMRVRACVCSFVSSVPRVSGWFSSVRVRCSRQVRCPPATGS